MAQHSSTIRVKKETHGELRVAAFEENTSIAEMAEKFINEGLKRRSKKKENKK
jgi:predicted HicB family RNase H-like nuclease